MKLNETVSAIFAEVPTSVGHTGKEQSIYKKELFVDLLPKDCKALRSKLRRNRDNFISIAIDMKGDKKGLQSLRESWNKYASQIYKDAKHICETNSNEQTQKLCTQFLNLMEVKA